MPGQWGTPRMMGTFSLIFTRCTFTLWRSSCWASTTILPNICAHSFGKRFRQITFCQRLWARHLLIHMWAKEQNILALSKTFVISYVPRNKILVKAFKQNNFAKVYEQNACANEQNIIARAFLAKRLCQRAKHHCQSLFSETFCQRLNHLCQKHFPAAATALLSPAAWCKRGSSRLHNGEQPDDDNDDDDGDDY